MVLALSVSPPHIISRIQYLYTSVDLPFTTVLKNDIDDPVATTASEFRARPHFVHQTSSTISNYFPIMAPCFVSASPVRGLQTTSQNSSVCTRPAVSSVRMQADKKDEKKVTFKDWLYSKLMHNNDFDYGFEPYFKQAMNARDAKMKEMYADQKNARKKS